MSDDEFDDEELAEAEEYEDYEETEAERAEYEAEDAEEAELRRQHPDRNIDRVTSLFPPGLARRLR